jgi:hypothetical protein
LNPASNEEGVKPPRFGAALLALCALPACTVGRGVTSSRASQAGMPCSEADRVAKGALLRLGYSPETVAAPKPGAPGTITGRKNSGWSSATPEPGLESTATVTITCSNRGAEFEAQTDEPLPGSLTFKSDFAGAIEKVAARRIARPRLKDHPETGLVISVEPLRGGDASAEFGEDLPAAGITPVRLRIDNRTDRTYAFTTGAVQLVTQEGERVDPIGADTAALKANLQAAMRTKRIADATIAPQSVLSGFLYFPASTYRRATLVLIDQETEEEEGFSVDF